MPSESEAPEVDRLEVIRHRLYGGEGGPIDDIAWLISEVQRLRQELAEADG